MPKKKRNSRLETYNKLREIKKSNTRDVAKLQLEDLDGIIKDEHFKNILLLRKFIKEGNPLDYFNEDIENERNEIENE